jgi:D-beta-D-heptose 7-phosphate kinase/D-beta-D-heptose 1-phosphate adenosyltransferase
VTGAGDTVIAVLAAGIAAGADLAQAPPWRNLAAGLVVRKLGVAHVTRAELQLRCISAASVDAVCSTREQGARVRARGPVRAASASS